MSALASQITSLRIIYSTVYSRHRSKKTSKLCVTGLCEGNSPVTGEFPTQRASNAENVSIWWRHHVVLYQQLTHKQLEMHGYVFSALCILMTWCFNTRASVVTVLTNYSLCLTNPTQKDYNYREQYVKIWLVCPLISHNVTALITVTS